MSARFGMDLDLSKMSVDDKAVCAGAIHAYKQIREVTHLGDLYRLERPHEAPRGALNFVSADHSRAVVFVLQLQDGQPLPVRPQGLDPNRVYVVREFESGSRTSVTSAGRQKHQGQRTDAQWAGAFLFESSRSLRG
ncbi:MAG TPA: GH36 C-terminal domain-containing protein [Candidatus Acidoferrum sp.]|nr:GH36 C-terminal domain-containing protein [Candidatus Acidoferrum sp.]